MSPTFQQKVNAFVVAHPYVVMAAGVIVLLVIAVVV